MLGDRPAFPARPLHRPGGGSDLIFPHHEFSAGHATAGDGKPLAEHYVHTGMVGLDGEKMSKSLGNLVLVSKLRAAGEDPMAVRAVLVGQHYRTDWEWTDELLSQAKDRLAAWRSRAAGTTPERAEALVAQLRTHLADDLDSPSALAALDEWAAEAPGNDPTAQGATTVLAALDALLGLKLA